MYGRDEYRYYANRLGAIASALDGEADALLDLADEYRNDATATFQGAYNENKMPRATMLAARVAVIEAMEAIDRAMAALPAVSAERVA